jgi:hypothetical protein
MKERRKPAEEPSPGRDPAAANAGSTVAWPGLMLLSGSHTHCSTFPLPRGPKDTLLLLHQGRGLCMPVRPENTRLYLLPLCTPLHLADALNAGYIKLNQAGHVLISLLFGMGLPPLASGPIIQCALFCGAWRRKQGRLGSGRYLLYCPSTPVQQSMIDSFPGC